ncbi:MAG: Hsp70 family protein, partial [Candidatus Methanomethylophilaceae archaeon]|nr:Hsp70 family protein [Candidatus Methanomethylophilaceae archaeon]
TFDIDANGIINVSAKDKGTGKEQKITIASSNKLSKEEIDNMVKQAEQFADADKKKREEIELVNQAETAVYSVKKSLEELGDKVSNEERAKIEAAITDLENAQASKDVEQIKQKMEALYKAMEPISQKIYEQAAKEQQAQGGCNCGSGPAGQQSQESKKSDGDFVDADYKIVDDE